VRAFIDALTQGGPGGTPKPIEMHAHDPKRYVGDMLAWLHQTMPNERENLLILLKGCDKTGVATVPGSSTVYVSFIMQYNSFFTQVLLNRKLPK
jgi:hypothetical protein